MNNYQVCDEVVMVGGHHPNRFGIFQYLGHLPLLMPSLSFTYSIIFDLFNHLSITFQSFNYLFLFFVFLLMSPLLISSFPSSVSPFPSSLSSLAPLRSPWFHQSNYNKKYIWPYHNGNQELYESPQKSSPPSKYPWHTHD